MLNRILFDSGRSRVGMDLAGAGAGAGAGIVLESARWEGTNVAVVEPIARLATVAAEQLYI